MLRTLVSFTLRYRYAVLALAGLLCVLGLIALSQLPFDAFPDTTPVMVQVNVSAPGWAPEDLERMVTYPVERALTGLAGLAEVRSISKYGLCQVTTIFEDGTDLYLARQQVSERLITVELPNEPAVKYADVTAEKAKRIFEEHVLGGKMVTEYALAAGSERTL